MGNKCLIPSQLKLFYLLSSDRWLQHVEPLWAHLGFAAPLIPWYWCCGSPVESEGIGGPSKLESRRLWVNPQWQQHFHNALLPTQQLCCVAGRVIFSFIVMLELQYLNDTYYKYMYYICILNFSGGAWISQPYTYVCNGPPPCGLCMHFIASPLPLHRHHLTYTTPQVLQCVYIKGGVTYLLAFSDFLILFKFIKKTSITHNWYLYKV